ncbi:keratin, type I cytoskeletal 9-like [Panicum virgatum]|uniref:keratin, type I cytoskeletal 9-like n=1 Tax=Panicum virgatum TaxID=38727 RepID=UPI0019D51656|nr:keratin, type I cytoskeletal 9-like [Panicum virgatum]
MAVSVLGKFGLDEFVRSAPPMAQHTAEWRQIDQTVVNWIYTTVNKSVFDIIYRPRVSAFTLWTELRSITQGDAGIDEYCSHLKHLADKLRDIGQPVSETSQVLNLLRGLNPRYRHVKPVITSRRPPHTFQSARSFLALEELQLKHDDKTEAGQAFLAGHGGPANSGGSASHGSSSGHGAPSSGTGGSPGGDTGGNRGYRTKNKRRGCGPNGGSAPSGGAGAGGTGGAS